MSNCLHDYRLVLNDVRRIYTFVVLVISLSTSGVVGMFNLSGSLLDFVS